MAKSQNNFADIAKEGSKLCQINPKNAKLVDTSANLVTLHLRFFPSLVCVLWVVFFLEQCNIIGRTYFKRGIWWMGFELWLSGVEMTVLPTVPLSRHMPFGLLLRGEKSQTAKKRSWTLVWAFDVPWSIENFWLQFKKVRSRKKRVAKTVWPDG